MLDLSKAVYFDIDGICQLKIYGKPELLAAILSELKFYQIDPGAKPLTLDIEVELESLDNFVASANPPDMPPYDFHGQHKLAKWVARFERLTQAPHRIKFYGNWASRLIVSKQIIEPAIRWLAQPLGFIFVHSSCLCKDGKGILVAGEGGSGKTRLLLRWLSQGNPFLSDDYTILSYGQARRFVTPLRIGGRLLKESGAAKNLSAGRRLEIYGRTALRRVLFNYAKLQAKLDIRELFPQISLQETVELKAAIVIDETGKNLSGIDPKEMVEKLLKINQAEMYGFADYLEGLADRTHDHSFKEFFSYQKERLSAFLEKIPCFQVGPLRDLSAERLDDLRGKIYDQIMA
jgi:hypothetical protein